MTLSAFFEKYWWGTVVFGAVAILRLVWVWRAQQLATRAESARLRPAFRISLETAKQLARRPPHFFIDASHSHRTLIRRLGTTVVLAGYAAAAFFVLGIQVHVSGPSPMVRMIPVESSWALLAFIALFAATFIAILRMYGTLEVTVSGRSIRVRRCVERNWDGKRVFRMDDKSYDVMEVMSFSVSDHPIRPVLIVDFSDGVSILIPDMPRYAPLLSYLERAQRQRC